MSVPLPGLEDVGPPRSLRLEVPVWGIDPASDVVAFAALVPQADTFAPRLPRDAAPVVRWDRVKLPGKPSDPPHLRWWGAMREIGPTVAHLKRAWGHPALVVIEQPFSGSHQTEPTSYMALTVILTALGRELGEATQVHLVNANTWKLLSTGSGFAPGLPAAPRGSDAKEKRRVAAVRRKAEKARLIAWANTAGYAGDDSNEADAVGIATAAGVLLERGRG